MHDPTPTKSLSLRDLPLGARWILTVFLCAAGISYLAGLNQLHFQHAPAGEPLPGLEDTKEAYHGKEDTSTLARLITADESKPFSASGTMRPAFFEKASGWKKDKRQRAEKDNCDEKQAEKALRADREMEVTAMVDWMKAGGKKENYEKFPMPTDTKDDVMERQHSDFFVKEDGRWYANVSAIMETRCARCHAEGKTGSAGEIHLDKYENVKDYLEPEKRGGGISLRKLAQSTHVHLPGFAMLLGLTGLIFGFTSYPGFVRAILCPLPLAAQLLDIAGWWLMRIDANFAYLTLATGGVVALGLVLQIVLGVLNMYGWSGKTAWLVILLAAAGGGFVVKVKIVDPYLAYEKSLPSVRD